MRTVTAGPVRKYCCDICKQGHSRNDLCGRIRWSDIQDLLFQNERNNEFMTTGSPDREEVMMKLFGDIEAVCFDIMHGEEKKKT